MLGARGEYLAERFLRRAGFRIVARNYRCPAGELDLIARDGDALVFIEVKTRAADDDADPEENIGPAKQSQLIRTARDFIARHRFPPGAYRFDAVAIVLPESGEPEIRHIRDAFDARE